MSTTVRATDFARNFARYQDEAIREGVIVVTSHDRVVGGYLSAEELARYRRLRSRDREGVDGPDDATAADIFNTRYGVETP
jgi:hypothetical protein